MTDAAVQKVTIDIWSDVMCPWCAIGYGQLSKALDELEGEIEAEIRWRPFELNPSMPEEGEEQAAHISRKYRRTAEETQGVRDQMKAVAKDAGVSLEYSGAKTEGGDAPAGMMWNTFAAHRLLEWALETHGTAAQMRLKLALFRAHFNQRRLIGERDVLLDIAAECGLDRDEANVALDDEGTGFRVRAWQKQAADYNITGVPATLLDGKFLIPGAQGAETFANTLRRWVDRRD